MEQPGTPGKRVAWKPSRAFAAPSATTSPNASRPPSRPPSRPGSRANSVHTTPNSSARGSTIDLPGEFPTERPPNKRTRSKFGFQPSRPRYQRSKSSSHPNGTSGSGARPLGEGAVPLTAIARLAQRTQNNLRMWYLRHSNGTSRRRTEVEKMREIEKSQLLFAQMFAVTPMVLISASSLQAEEGQEKKVPVVLQLLSIKVTQESAKHYRNMLRIHLEYGAGLGLIKWEIVRGYRDLFYLRARLKARLKSGVRSKKIKLPKLPRPKQYGLKVTKVKSDPHNAGIGDDENDDDEFDESDDALTSSGEEDEGDEFDGQVSGIPSSEYRADNESEGGGPGSTTGGANVPVSNGSITSRHPSISSPHNEGYPDSPTHHGHHHHRLHLGRPHHSQKHAKISYARAVEDWLTKIKYIYTFRSDTNDLMRFLELSHLSLKLSSDYSRHGKEGTLIIRSRASEMGWHVNHWHPRDFKDMVERHTKKWVLVRDSYLVVVDNIYSTRIREVFFVDSHFQVKHITEEQGDLVAYAANHEDIDGVIEALPEPEGVHKRQGAKSVFLHLVNNERELKLAATSERDLRRWQASILQMKVRSPWSNQNRFGSFAPVRKNVFGQWFVDGRDYMWVLSEALENARDTIFILDWWLSPELYLRRPPEGNQKWRLDRVLQRKAQQGVKIFVVVYRNVGPTIPIDSMWTKHSLLDLHENIHVMRSPNQLQNKGSLFWAHHEKLCVIDSTVAFNGGIDLCFGRWDTWQHTLTDDASKTFLPKDPTPEEWLEKTQLFPGKDYSNARVKDFYELNRPFDDMYDRGNVPRMPWHDIHQMVVGQPARDFARHFVQRWNYVLRQKIPSRPTPLLLPPSDFSQEDLERLQLTGTCEYQVLRSSGEWSLGLKQHEQSIQNAYLSLIEESEHLVYIENQFFVTSTEVDGVLIENQIGNALVQRIVRAHENGEAWKAFILIPLMPGFEAEVDTDKASSVRVICQCQFNSISRGPHSIFYRLESLGIRPDQYINFFSLRKWGKFSDTPESPNGGRVVTELLYIHAKCMIVDDRIAIIGSANINERSMRGVRDSEVAVCVRDTEVIHSNMAGKPWKAAKFAHSLRMRLMREHLGVDIDKFEIVERLMESLDATALRIKNERERSSLRRGAQSDTGESHASQPSISTGNPVLDEFPEWLYPELHSFNWYAGTSVNRGVRDFKKFSHDSRVQGNAEHKEEVDGDGIDFWKTRQKQTEGVKMRTYSAAEPDLKMEQKARAIMNELVKDRSITSRDQFRRIFYAKFTGQDILRPVKRAADLPMPHTDEDGLKAVNNENIPIDPWLFDDPLNEQFVNDKWLAVAERNTLIFRLVFRCQPDDEVETWKDYKTFVGHLERFYEKQREDGGPDTLRKSGHHEPERVDKHVLDGSIRRPDPNALRLSKIKATQTNHHSPSSSSASASQNSQTPRVPPSSDPQSPQVPLQQNDHNPDKDPIHELGEDHYKDLLRESIRNDQDYERLPPELQRERNDRHHLHRLRASRIPIHPHRAIHELEDGLEHLTLKNNLENAAKDRLFPSGFPNQGLEFGGADHGKTQNGSSTVDRTMNGSAINGHSDGRSASNGYPSNGIASNGNASNGYAGNTSASNGSADINGSSEGAQNGGIAFPTVEDNGRASLKPSVSSTSARRRAMTLGSAAGAPMASKPARKWGHFEHVLDAQVAEDMLQGITGHLVVFPTEWLNRELDSGNWNFQLDRIAPLEIYD